MDSVDRMLGTMQHAWSALGRNGARWVEGDGVGALVTRAVPNRSIVNSVVYRRGADLEAAYDRLEAEFAEVDAWMVWVPESDTDNAAFLEAHGHKLDADPAMMALDDVEFHLYITQDGCVLGIDDCDGDAGVMFVATLPEARGRGLAGGLLAVALVEARDRGCDISTLQATKMGEPVYARLGYQRLGAIQMWEKRKA